MGKFNIDSFEERLQAKNQFDGNLRYGAKVFHERTNRSGVGKPSSGYLIREHAMVVIDTGQERYQRVEGCWENVETCPVCGTQDRDFSLSRFGLDIYRCANCSHRYLNPRVKFDVAMKLYADDKTASDIYTQPMQVEIDEIKYQYGLDLMDQLHLPAKNKIMDIGCGAGVFLKMSIARKKKLLIFWKMYSWKSWNYSPANTSTSEEMKARKLPGKSALFARS